MVIDPKTAKSIMQIRDPWLRAESLALTAKACSCTDQFRTSGQRHVNARTITQYRTR